MTQPKNNVQDHGKTNSNSLAEKIKVLEKAIEKAIKEKKRTYQEKYNK